MVCLLTKINDAMEAVEFNAQIQDGRITVPSRFKNFSNKRVKVILLEEVSDPYEEGKAALLAANQAAKEAGLDKMTTEEIDAEIAAVRNGD